MAIKINKHHGTYNRSRRSVPVTGIQYFVVHYTGAAGSAKNNCIYFSGGNRNASADWFIDKDGSIWEYNDPKSGYYSWHCGDGKGKYGITNSNSVGIEVCSKGEDFTNAQVVSLHELYEYACKMCGHKLTVVRHYDASRKQCPAPYVNETKWSVLKGKITGASNTDSSARPAYAKGRYKTAVDKLNVRTKPKTGSDSKILKKSQLTPNAQKNSHDDGTLKKGTVMDVSETVLDAKGNTWGRIPSGWICMKYNGKSRVAKA